MHKNARKVMAGGVSGLLLLTQFFFALPAQAAVANWMRGADIVPNSTTDFGGSAFQQSLRNLKNTGATYVDLVVPYYQSNIWSTDVAGGWNTPTDAALGSAIDYAHSIGLSVALDMHVDPYSGDWRAYIDPSDRAGWFQNYGNNLLHVASIGASHHAEMIVIGSELVDMSTYAHNGDNTWRWQNLIGQIRRIFSGALTYDANSNNNNGDLYQDEKNYIGFWSQLDYAGLSVYYNLNTNDNSVASLAAQWDYWNQSDLRPFAAQVGKPLLFVEAGYRSVDNAHTQPWNWYMGGGANTTEQANDYSALLSYWDNYSYVAGTFFWNWETDPNAGGANTTTYTVQNKPAQQIMTQWFSGNGQQTPPPSGTYSFTGSGSANPSSGSPGTAIALSANIKNMGAALGNGIVDLEVYDQSNSRVFQKFFQSVSMGSGASQTFTANWIAGSATTYHMSVGIFSGDWSQNYYWNGNAGIITISGSSTPAAPPPPPLSQPGPLNVWWPTDGSHVSGVQPLKAMVENIDVANYRMFWQVGSGQWNEMGNSSTNYPHKETLINFSGWTWNGSGSYPITLTATQMNGTTVMVQKTINVFTQ